MNKDDFIGWRTSIATQEFRESVVAELDNLIADLVNTAGNDPLEDKYRRGQIVGLQWLLDWTPKFIIEESEEDGIDSEGTQDSY